MKSAQKNQKKNLTRMTDRLWLRLLLFPVIVISLLLLIQLHFWLIPCNSGFFIGGCELGMIAIYAFVFYEIIVYAFFYVAFMVLTFYKAIDPRSFSWGTIFVLGVVIAISGVVGLLYVRPLSYLFISIFGMVFDAFDKGYLPGFLLSTIHSAQK
jgi:hypothetical protein